MFGVFGRAGAQFAREFSKRAGAGARRAGQEFFKETLGAPGKIDPGKAMELASSFEPLYNDREKNDTPFTVIQPHHVQLDITPIDPTEYR